MNRPQIRFRHALAAAVMLVLAGPAAADQVGGSCTSKGKDVPFSDGVVYREPNTFDETKQDVVVVLANVALDKAAIAAARRARPGLGSRRRRQDRIAHRR